MLVISEDVYVFSTLNYLMYVRSNPLDYDNWANMTNDESWNYHNLLKYFKRSIEYSGVHSDGECSNSFIGHQIPIFIVYRVEGEVY